ncbi:MAG: hypothetical protein ACPGUE_07975 [Marinomonas sp.]
MSSTTYAQLLFEGKIHFPLEEAIEQESETKVENPQITPTKQTPKGLIPKIEADTVWQLTGINTSQENKLIIIEIGKHKAAYRNRINEERGILPGPFNIQLYPFGFRTSKGSKLSFSADTRVKVFTLDKGKEIAEFKLTKLTPQNTGLSKALYAFDLGPEDQTVLQGFESMTPSHPLLAHTLKVRQKKLNPFTRLSLDPLVRDGISGITSLKLPLPAGKWRLHLWTEDVGYWQTLPEQIERRIRINGQDRDYQHTPPWQWVQQRYTQNKFRLSKFSQLNNLTSWRAIGQYRGGHKTFEVEAKNESLMIELAGATKMSTTITGLMVEKLDQYLLAEANFNRAQWFNARWPLLPYVQEDKPKSKKPSHYRLTKHNPLFIKLPLDKTISLDNLSWQTSPFTIEKRLYLPQLERNLGSYKANPAGSFLAIKPLLITATSPDKQHSGELHLTIKAPAHLAPGTYTLQLIHKASQQPLDSLSIQLLDVNLADLKKPVGVYLDLAPHLFLSYERKNMADKQLVCDLETLANLDFSGVAPHFPIPKNKGVRQDYQARVQRLVSLGFQPPFLDYAGLKNLRYQFGQDETSKMLTALSQTLDHKPKILAISIADEPSNASSKGFALNQMASLVDNSHQQNQQAPALLKAAHLNNPKDRRWLGELDIALINHGYGINRQSIQNIRNQDAQVWLYNMPNRRLAAGFFLWKYKLGGYLQWHARMPTADPFDPTDGREDDQQLLPVMAQLCAKVADLHPDLIEIAEGITDHKWLNWLDLMSKSSTPAFKLRQQLLQKIPNSWQRAENLSSQQLQTWRNEIEELALSMTSEN